MSFLTRFLRAAPAATLLACAQSPVAWDDPVEEKAGEPSALFWRAGNKQGFDSLKETVPGDRGRCAVTQSIFSANGVVSSAYSVWWSVRLDSSAALLTSASSDGRIWAAPVQLDSATVGRDACAWPRPEIAVDGDNVHVVYGMKAQEGSGIFLSHSMDRARTFHSPVAVVYGARPTFASVAARGNFVIVAFEDPNTTPTRISVAISTTMAHLFEFREVISSESAAASEPSVIVLDKWVDVGWRRMGRDTTRITRRGTIR